MSRARPFPFARSFSVPGGGVEPLESPEPTITVAEHEARLAAAVAAAREGGHAAGLAAAREEETARLARALEAVAMQMGLAAAALEAVAERAQGEAVLVAEALMARLAAAFVARHPADALAHDLAGVLDDLRGAPHIVVRVAPALVAPARERLTALARDRGLEGKLMVMPEPGTAPGDVTITWADGAAITDRRQLEERLRAAVARATGRAPLLPPVFAESPSPGGRPDDTMRTSP